MSNASSTTKTTKTSPAAAILAASKMASASKGDRLTLSGASRIQMGASLRKRKGEETPSSSGGQPLTGLLGTGLIGLSTCNSGFLSSLLADVAKAKEEILQAKRESSSAPSVKRRRISNANSSTGNASSVQQTNKPLTKSLLQEPSNILDLLWEESWMPRPDFAALHRQRRQAPDAAAVAAAVAVPPPRSNIPATVSDSFERLQDQEEAKPAPTTAGHSDKRATEPTEDTFGWFVDMDEDDDNESAPMICDDPHRSPKSSSSSDSLAFSASVAPRAANHDEELEWAKAADTVDDVLGDFF